MNKKYLLTTILGMMGMALVCGVGCQVTNDSTSEPKDVYKIMITGDQTLDSFSDGKLNAIVYKNEAQTDEKVTFTSKNEELLKIDANGNMEAQNLTGVATIEVSHSSGVKEDININVVNPLSISPYFASTNANENGEIILVEDSSTNLSLNLTYNGKNVSEASYTYSCDSSDYFTLNQTTGEIVAKAIGKTTLSATASWRGYKETLEFTVIVCEDIQVEVEGPGLVTNFDGSKNVELYTFNKTINDVVYVDNVQLSCNFNGAEGSVTNWYSTDESVATVSQDGLVEVVGLGNAEIYFEFKTEYFTYTSLPLKVVVEIPIIERNDEMYILDLSTVENLNVYEMDKAFLFEKDVQVDEVTFDGVIQPMSEGKVDITALETGEHQGIFTSKEEGYAIKVPVLVVSKVIKTAAELAAGLHTYTNATEVVATEGGGTFYDYDGYYILGNNIDCTGIIIESPHGNSVQTSLNNTYLISTKGFKGTFDGRGFAIQNASFWAGGLFGEVASGAVIKNTRFENATVHYAWGVTTGILGVNIADATVENCYFDVASSHYPGADGYGNSSAVLAAWTYFGAKIRNCVFNMRENAGSLPLIRNEGGSWNGMQGPYIADNVVIVYQTAEGSLVPNREGQTSIRTNDFVNRKKINLLESNIVTVAVGSGTLFELKTDDESVLSIDGNTASGLKVGTANIWVVFKIGEFEVITEKIEISVVEEAPKDYYEITSEQELRDISGVVSDKPYKLANNITITGNGTVIAELNTILDLNGYTISRASTNAADMHFIKNIGANGVLKNGKIDYFFGPTGATGHVGFLVNNNDGLVENIQINAELNSYADFNNLVGLFEGGSGTYRNMVVHVINHTTTNYAGIFRATIENLTLENCIFISQNVPLGAIRPEWGANAKDWTSFKSATNCVLAESVEAYTAENYDTSSFSSEYWTINEATKLPEIKLN